MIVCHLEQKIHKYFGDSIELDESYFGGYCTGKHGRGAAGKVAVFSILKCGRKVYIQVISDTKISTLIPWIVNRVAPDSFVYTGSYRSYDILGISEFIHYRINHSKLFVDRQNHINGIENFWSKSKRVLRKYNGIDHKLFPLFLKEYEFRFNFGTPSEQLKTLRKWCDI